MVGEGGSFQLSYSGPDWAHSDRAMSAMLIHLQDLYGSSSFLSGQRDGTQQLSPLKGFQGFLGLTAGYQPVQFHGKKRPLIF